MGERMIKTNRINSRKLRAAAIVFTFFLAGFSRFASANDLSYDPYAPEVRPLPKRSSCCDVVSKLLVYPFELIRWPVDKTLVLVEKEHLDKKAIWIYDQIKNQGITPQLNLFASSQAGAGAEVDMIRVLRRKEQFPDGIMKSWIRYAKDVQFHVGSEIGLERIADTGYRVTGFVQYENRPEEHFYGIGPDSSAGNGTSFRMETTHLRTTAGYDWTPFASANFEFGYRNINISEGEDGGRGQIDRTFFPQTIPGLGGDELVSVAMEIRHDSRNHKENSTEGGLRRFSLGFHEGVSGSEARYFKYVAEGSRYFRLGSDRRVFAVRLYGEHNDEVGKDRIVPFHQFAKLGGFGTKPRLSLALRGFDFNRFFDESALLLNAEYRYTIWEYRDFKVDAVFFWDEGQVFGEFSEFQMGDFRESYGMGFRVSAVNNILLALEFAHGDEGTNVYVKSRTPF